MTVSVTVCVMLSYVLNLAELILQPFRHFTFVTTHSPTLPSLYPVTADYPTFSSLYLRHNSFYNPSVTLPTSQLILQSFRRFTYVTTHSQTLPSLYLRHSSFSNHSVASPTSQLILQPFFLFSYVTSCPGEPPMIHCCLESG